MSAKSEQVSYPESISCAAVSHAKTSPTRAERLVLEALEAACFLKPRASSENLGHESSCSKTPAQSLGEVSAMSWARLPALGMMRSGCLYELATPVPLTSESARLSLGGAWPTPTASDAGNSRRHGYMLTGHTGTTLLDAVIDFHFPRDPETNKGGRRGKPLAVLRPEFAEALMGLPIGWTDLSDYEQLAIAW